jgi:hypothetical protein
MQERIEIFLCYAHEDEVEMKRLAAYLGALRRQGFFDVWNDREIIPGADWMQEIDRHLNTAQVILLLVSEHFLNSDYCYVVEMKRAIERHERGEARIIPVILRPVYYQRTPFARLRTLPTNGQPISSWKNQHEAFFDVAEGIRRAVEEAASRLTQQ